LATKKFAKICDYIWQQNLPIWLQNLPFWLQNLPIWQQNLSIWQLKKLPKSALIFGNKFHRFGYKNLAAKFAQNLPLYLATKVADLTRKQYVKSANFVAKY
jgi:hypothetical protein